MEALLPLTSAIFGAFLTYWFIRQKSKKNLAPQWLYRYTDGELTGIVKTVGTILDKEWELLNYGRYSRSKLSGGGYEEIVVHQTCSGLLMIMVECPPDTEGKITKISWRSTTTDETISAEAIGLDRNKALVERAKAVLLEVRNHFRNAEAALATKLSQN